MIDQPITEEQRAFARRLFGGWNVTDREFADIERCIAARDAQHEAEVAGLREALRSAQDDRLRAVDDLMREAKAGAELKRQLEAARHAEDDTRARLLVIGATVRTLYDRRHALLVRRRAGDFCDTDQESVNEIESDVDDLEREEGLLHGSLTSDMERELVTLRTENAQHCLDFQAVAEALGILDELPEQARVLERIGELRERLEEALYERDEANADVIEACISAPITTSHTASPEVLGELEEALMLLGRAKWNRNLYQAERDGLKRRLEEAQRELAAVCYEIPVKGDETFATAIPRIVAERDALRRQLADVEAARDNMRAALQRIAKAAVEFPIVHGSFLEEVTTAALTKEADHETR